jgi:mono/diheme cytochrome c family protein
VQVSWRAALAGAGLLVLFGIAAADTQPQQLARGEDVYFANCSMCHNDDLSGGAAHSAPALQGDGFMSRWTGRSSSDLLERVRTTMPEGLPKSLSDQAYADVVAFLLKSNKISLGSSVFSEESAKQIAMR